MKRVLLIGTMMLLAVALFASEDRAPVQQMQIEVSGPGLVTHGTRVVIDGKDVLISQIPDTLNANGYACQLDSAYPFEADIADDMDNTTDADWTIDSITTWWANWNGFTTWANVPNVRVILYADNSGMPADSPYVEVQVEAADFVATTIATDKYSLVMDMSSYDFTIPAGSWWFEIKPSNVFTVNGQTGWQCEAGIGNGQELYFRSVVLGVPNWTSATTQWGQALEPGIIMYGTAGSGLIPVTWDFETGDQGWTNTSSASFPDAFAVTDSAYSASSYQAGHPLGEDSCMCIAPYNGTGVAEDTAISPVFYGFDDTYLYWVGQYENFASYDSVEVLLREATGGSWGAWTQVKLYTIDLHEFEDSLDVTGYTGDSFQIAFFYSDGGYNNPWIFSFDNVGPVLVAPPSNHDVGAVSVLNPGDMVAPGTEDVIGVVRNFGGFDETFDVHCVVTDPTDAVVLDTTINTSVLMGEYDTLNFGQVNMMDGYTYDIMIATLLAGDENPANDTVTGQSFCTATYWYSLPAMPRTASGPGIGYDSWVGNTYIHVFGGNPAPNTDHNVYDWAAETWSAGVSVPGDFRYGAFASYNHKIYLFGGWQALNTVWVYDCIGDSFYAGGNLVTGCNDAAATVDYDRGLIYIIGGGNGWTELDCVQVYDPAGDTCFAATSLPTPWMSAAAGYIGNDTLLFAFGRSASTYTNNYMFGIIDPANPANITWGTPTATTYLTVYRPGFANMADRLWVFGGGSGSYEVQTVMYQSNVGWAQLPDKITAGQNIGGCAAPVDTAVYDAVYAHVTPLAAGGYSPYLDVFEALNTGIIILGAEEDPILESPEAFTFRLLTPNPVAGNVQIQFALPTEGRVSFKIYDISGRTVNTSTFSNMSAGVHNLVWNRTDRSGQQVAAGSYFFRLEAGENTATGKLIVTE
ncbi:MAG: FlgD immunoglobulin-like domain containing protein [bacterium]